MTAIQKGAISVKDIERGRNERRHGMNTGQGEELEPGQKGKGRALTMTETIRASKKHRLR